MPLPPSSIYYNLIRFREICISRVKIWVKVFTCWVWESIEVVLSQLAGFVVSLVSLPTIDS